MTFDKNIWHLVLAHKIFSRTEVLNQSIFTKQILQGKIHVNFVHFWRRSILRLNCAFSKLKICEFGFGKINILCTRIYKYYIFVAFLKLLDNSSEKLYFKFIEILLSWYSLVQSELKLEICFVDDGTNIMYNWVCFENIIKRKQSY